MNSENRQDPVPKPEIRKLDNGLTVVLQELHYSPVTAVTLAYRVGSSLEAEDQLGLSHFCEHMMFKGSQNFGPGTYWRMIQRKGGAANAYTSRDVTVYYSVVPRRGLNDILDLEADRMTGCIMDPEHVASEKNVILEEELMTQRDDPDGSLDSLLYSESFPHHPYGRSITGTAEDISSFTRQGLVNFYRRFYSPSNAVISIVGDMDTEETMKLVQKKFGTLAGGDVPKREIPSEPPQTAQRRASMEHASHLPRLSLGFRVPGGANADSPALSLISVFLSSGRSSRFEELLVKPSLTLDASVSTNTHVMPGLLEIRCLLPPGNSPEKVEDIIFEELERLAHGGMDRRQLEVLKKRRRAWSIISNADPLGRSRRFASGWAKYGKPVYYWDFIRSLDGVSPEDIARVAGKYLIRSNSTVAALVPSPSSGVEGVAASLAPESDEGDLQPPAVQEPSAIQVPDRLLKSSGRSVSDGIEEIEMKNGMRLIVKPDSSFPVVSIGFSCPMGSSREPAELTGLSMLTTETMHYGTAEEDSIRFNARLEELGAGMQFTSTSEYAGGIITVLVDDTEDALSVISDMLRKPAFRQQDLDSVRNEAVSSLREWLSSPIGAAMNSFSRQSTDPPERSSIPTPETLQAIQRKDLVRFHRLNCRPSGTVIVAVGDISAKRMAELMENCFQDWRNHGQPQETAEPENNSPESSSKRIPLEGRQQMALVMGSPAPPRMDDDSHAIAILNRILGDGIGSRLGRNIRETGLAYYVGSIYLPLLSRGRLAVTLLTSPASFREALARLRSELKRLAGERVSSSELRLEKASYLGNRVLATMKYDSIAQILLLYASLGMPLDHDRTSIEKILKLTPDIIQRAAEKWLGRSPEYLSIAGGGNGI